jgi:hypothetical protein
MSLSAKADCRLMSQKWKLSLNHFELGARLYALWETDPIPYRTQNGGDYDIPSLELKLR